MNRVGVVILLSLLTGRLLAADAVTDTYGKYLLKQASSANPDLVALSLAVVPPKMQRRIVIASSDPGEIGREDAAEITQTRTTDGHIVIRLPLLDVSKETIGVFSVSFPATLKTEPSELEARAMGVRDQLARHISHAANLLDSYPYDFDAPLGARAQQLEERELAAHPDIEILVIHATPAKSDYNVVVGSNIGRIGKKADNDDMRCVFTGKPNLEVNATGNRFESEMQLHDVKGRVIGALGVVYAYSKQSNQAGLHAKAESVRAEIELQIPDSDSLFIPQQ